MFEFGMAFLIALIGAAATDAFKQGKAAILALIKRLRDNPGELKPIINSMSDDQIQSAIGKRSDVTVADVRRSADKMSADDVRRAADDLEKSGVMFESVDDIADFNKYLSEKNTDWPPTRQTADEAVKRSDIKRPGR